ncbi:hypothetical protein HDV02_006003 [Globomyces sp. JEL0801]|nr:hypothetical protein HDV02_006003 [Globomyces sp. JEL0801]
MKLLYFTLLPILILGRNRYDPDNGLISKNYGELVVDSNTPSFPEYQSAVDEEEDQDPSDHPTSGDESGSENESLELQLISVTRSIESTEKLIDDLEIRIVIIKMEVDRYKTSSRNRYAYRKAMTDLARAKVNLANASDKLRELQVKEQEIKYAIEQAKQKTTGNEGAGESVYWEDD